MCNVQGSPPPVNAHNVCLWHWPQIPNHLAYIVCHAYCVLKISFCLIYLDLCLDCNIWNILESLNSKCKTNKTQFIISGYQAQADPGVKNMYVTSNFTSLYTFVYTVYPKIFSNLHDICISNCKNVIIRNDEFSRTAQVEL